jgi:hypothetical protein
MRIASPWSAVAWVVAAGALGVAGSGCALHEAELARADEHFSHDENEKTLATLRGLDETWASLDTADRARYCYLRGMTDYRIGFKADARHWLAIAAEIEREKPGSLGDSAKKLTEEKLSQLNEVVWLGDVLPIEEPAGTRPARRTDASDDDSPKPKAKAKPAAGDDDSPKPKAKAKPAADDDDSPKPRAKTKTDE